MPIPKRPVRRGISTEQSVVTCEASGTGSRRGQHVAHRPNEGENEMFTRIARVPAAGASSTLPTTSRRAFGRRLGYRPPDWPWRDAPRPSPWPNRRPPRRQSTRSSCRPRMPRRRLPSLQTPPSRSLPTATRDSVAGTPVRRDYSDQIRATAGAQYPFAVVLGCIDSRVPIETVFDQGIGDIFSARIAATS